MPAFRRLHSGQQPGHRAEMESHPYLSAIGDCRARQEGTSATPTLHLPPHCNPQLTPLKNIFASFQTASWLTPSERACRGSTIRCQRDHTPMATAAQITANRAKALIIILFGRAGHPWRLYKAQLRRVGPAGYAAGSHGPWCLSAERTARAP